MARSQESWEKEVRVELKRRGFDPNEVETDVEGFGQDYYEYQNAPDEYVDAILDDGVWDR